MVTFLVMRNCKDKAEILKKTPNFYLGNELPSNVGKLFWLLKVLTYSPPGFDIISLRLSVFIYFYNNYYKKILTY